MLDDRPGLRRCRPAAAALLLWSALAVGADEATPEVLDVFPHDTGAFTQGLLLHDGLFYESTGLYGQSSLRRVAPLSGVVLDQVALPSNEFAEGLALVGQRLIQLTWRENVAHQYGVDDFGPLGDFVYPGEGWGLCHDGERLVMSDGSAELTFRDTDTFVSLGKVEVTLDGLPVGNLNELECVGSLVYANVWPTNTILRIDPGTGVVLTEIDASGLLTPAEAAQADVLNGIAFDPSTGHFYLTGKFWPKLFEVRFPFDPDGECLVGELAAVQDVRVQKSGGDGVALGWRPQVPASEYHANSVASAEHLPPPGPHLPDLPGGHGVAECQAAYAASACTDPDALVDPAPLLYYQVFAACGPGGLQEGP